VFEELKVPITKSQTSFELMHTPSFEVNKIGVNFYSWPQTCKKTVQSTLLMQFTETI
jgi:hypothetical protein